MNAPEDAPDSILSSKLSLRLDPRFARLGEGYASRVTPSAVTAPRLLHLNPSAAALLDLPVAHWHSPEGIAWLSGNAPVPGSTALASVYAGHQFGVYVPQLGDGRAILIAEVRNRRGERWELQLKGAGRTPYSRFGDGRAVLRSTVREYLCSEAMHALGIPTTRALSLIGATDPVQRETLETAAVLCRMAPSHIRFGHFEYFYYSRQFELLAPLADHLIDEHFPQLQGQPNRYATWLSEIVDRTARLIAQWQAVGFCHGVMNTDNMSALGLTIDYGPFGFMDAFDAGHICNHSDDAGRYAYGQQPTVGHWNCSRLLQATLPLLGAEPEAAVELANAILNRYPAVHTEAVMALWRSKLGLREAHDEDRALVNGFLNLIDQARADFTRSFRLLGEVRAAQDTPASLRAHLPDPAAFDAWLSDYRARLRAEGSEDGERQARMNRVNPKFVLRNHLLQSAIERAEDGDPSEVSRLFEIMRAPFDDQPGFEHYAEEPSAQVRHITVSCSS